MLLWDFIVVKSGTCFLSLVIIVYRGFIVMGERVIWYFEFFGEFGSIIYIVFIL